MTEPVRAVIGETVPEWVIPLSKLDETMARGSDRP